jgi:poly(A) polymerase
MFKKLFKRNKSIFSAHSKKISSSVVILGSKETHIDPKQVDQDAYQVVKALVEAGFEAYLVGGSVRDLMLGRAPKDYDIATSARPEQVRRLFKYSRVIGRRFKLVHVCFRGKDPIEVSTFRASVSHPSAKQQTNALGVLVSDNVYGTLEEDAFRRDFTINAFYYNPIDQTVLDIVGGLKDLREGMIRVIGDVDARLKEDPIRVLRALRFAAKLNFTLEKNLYKAIAHSHDSLAHVPGARLYDAFVQVFFVGYAVPMYEIMHKMGYFELLFQESAKLLQDSAYQNESALLACALKASDQRYQMGKTLNPGFLIGIILWPALQCHLRQYLQDGAKFFHALHQSIGHVLKDHAASMLVLPARITGMLTDMWILQYYLQQRRPKRIEWIATHRYYRAAIDMLEMRAQCGESLQSVVDWWHIYQSKPEQGKEAMRLSLEDVAVKKRRSKKKHAE